MALTAPTTPTQAALPARRLGALAPVLAAIAYPLLLQAFHAVLTGGDNRLAHNPLAMALLIACLLAPASGLALALRSAGHAPASIHEQRARLLALLSLAAPPLFVFTAFVLSTLGRPVPEALAWPLAWLALGVWAWVARDEPLPRAPLPPAAARRVAHGVVAAMLVVYVGFHLFNHLLGLLGPEAPEAVMRLGRRVYRTPAVEALLVALLLLQVALGAAMARRWTALAMDRWRALQIASGVYVGCFVLTHMNSALVSARTLHGTETDWAWASGAPTGLLLDAWSIRLVPHYALGVFFALAHLACGLRMVLLAHGIAAKTANRLCATGVLAAAAVATAILAGLCGARIH